MFLSFYWVLKYWHTWQLKISGRRKTQVGDVNALNLLFGYCPRVFNFWMLWALNNFDVTQKQVSVHNTVTRLSRKLAFTS